MVPFAGSWRKTLLGCPRLYRKQPHQRQYVYTWETLALADGKCGKVVYYMKILDGQETFELQSIY
jgi:hypothetical protein